MKVITEFPNFTLNKAITAKAALTAENKTPEEIQQNFGETFKLEGDKLKHFVNAVDVASQNPQNLKRVLVMTLNEGENPPAKATKIEETYYLPESIVTAPAPSASANPRGGKGGRRGGRDSGKPKGSPWGLSPEEKAAKTAGKGAGKANAPKPS